MPLDIGKMGLSDRNIYNEADRDQNMMFKINDNGDFLIKAPNGDMYTLEVRSFIDKNGNGGCWQKKVYFSNRDTYQRTGKITNKTIAWSNWILFIDQDDMNIRDNRITHLENLRNDLNNKYNDTVNRTNDINNRVNQLQDSINGARGRADDAWGRTDDIYRWAIRDIRLAGYQYIELQQAGEASGYVITGLINDGGGNYAYNKHVQRRVIQKLVNGNWYNSYFA